MDFQVYDRGLFLANPRAMFFDLFNKYSSYMMYKICIALKINIESP